MTDLRSPDDWGDVYAERTFLYEAFAERLEELLRNLLQDADLGYVESFWWTTETDYFVDMISVRAREGAPVDDPFAAFPELCGVTVVTRTKAESESICALVEAELDVQQDATLSFAAAELSNADPGPAGRPGRVYYDAPRIVVTLPEARRELPEWSRFDGLRAEIRVRTQLQEAWQKIDEEVLPYLRDASYPEDVQAAIVRAVGLIAAADDELSSIGATTDDAEMTYAHSLELGHDAPLDMSALYVYLRDSQVVARLVATAEEAGMLHEPDPVRVSEAFLWLVRRCGFDSIRALDTFLVASEPRARDILERLTELVSAEDGTKPRAATEAVVEWLLLVLTRAGADVVALTRYRTEIEASLNTLIGNRVER